MGAKAAVTVHRPPDEVRRLWESSDHRPEHIAPGGKLGEAIAKLTGREPLAKVKDDLRRFKQHVETGEIPRSDGSPEGELAERKLKQRPAQPLDEAELE